MNRNGNLINFSLRIEYVRPTRIHIGKSNTNQWASNPPKTAADYYCITFSSERCQGNKVCAAGLMGVVTIDILF